MLTAASRRVQAKTMFKYVLDDLEVTCGLHANPHGLLACEALRPHTAPPTDLITYYWVHNMLQGGVFTVECSAMLSAAAPLGIKRTDVQAFLADASWCFPKFGQTKARDLHEMFDPRRQTEKEPDKVRASCAELLGSSGCFGCSSRRSWAGEGKWLPSCGPSMQHARFWIACSHTSVASSKAKLLSESWKQPRPNS